MKRKLLLSFTFLVTLTVFSNANAHYELATEGAMENSDNIRYTFSLPSGSDVSSIPTSWRSYIGYAANTWEDASPNIDISTTTSTTVKNRIYKTSLGSYVGETIRADYDGDKIIDGFHMRFNKDYTFYYNGSDDYDVETTALHEWGHVLGLDGVYSYTSHVMYEDYTGIKTSLHAHDIEGINALYSGN